MRVPSIFQGLKELAAPESRLRDRKRVSEWRAWQRRSPEGYGWKESHGRFQLGNKEATSGCAGGYSCTLSN